MNARNHAKRRANDEGDAQPAQDANEDAQASAPHLSAVDALDGDVVSEATTATPPRASATEGTVLLGSVAAVYVTLDRVHPWRDNPRWKDKRKRDKAVRLLTKSIRRFGFGEPILARQENGEIIAGHTRWLAARRLALETIPVRFMNLPEGESHALALADNRIAEYGQWDEDKLESVIRQLEEDEVDLELGTGFDEEEIEKYLGSSDDDLDLETDDGVPNANARDALKYRLVVDCKGEDEQAALLERLEQEGFKCKPLIS